MKIPFTILIIISLFSCSKRINTNINLANKYEVRFNNIIYEYRYLDSNLNTIVIVNIDSVFNSPLDSVVLDYSAQKVKVYKYKKKKYLRDKNSSLENYYFENFISTKEQVKYFNDRLIEEDLAFIYNVFSNLNSNNPPSVNQFDDNSLTFSISELNLVFRNMPLYLQECFFNQKLYRANLLSHKNNLLELEYVFQNGTAIISYEYENGIVKNRTVECVDIDGSKNINIFSFDLNQIP